MTDHNTDHNYYQASIHPSLAAISQPHPALSESIEADVCVVGAGITGCSAALHLAEQGYKVVVLEAQHVGFGASGRNGGQAIFGLACGESKLTQLLGQSAAKQVFDMTLEGLALLKQRIQAHDIPCDYQAGMAHAAIKTRHVRELQEWQQQLARDFDYPLTWLGRDELSTQISTPRYQGALLDPNSGHLHPLNYTLGLAQAAEQAGAVFFANSPVKKLVPATRADAATELHTPNARVSAKHVILAGNAYLSGLAPTLQQRIMPVGTYMIATEPLGAERAKALMPKRAAFCDINFVLDYFRISADHRVLFGGEVSYSAKRPRELTATMRAHLLRVFPELHDCAIDYSWGGNVGITLNRAPHFGRLGHNLYFAQGFSGHGVALTGLAGKLIAEAVVGEAERFELFSRIPHRPFPGGRHLRTPALVLAMAWYRLRDRL